MVYHILPSRSRGSLEMLRGHTWRLIAFPNVACVKSHLEHFKGESLTRGSVPFSWVTALIWHFVRFGPLFGRDRVLLVLVVASAWDLGDPPSPPEDSVGYGDDAGHGAKYHPVSGSLGAGSEGSELVWG